MILSKKRMTKALIRLGGCPGWSAPVLFANHRRQVFSRRGPFNKWIDRKKCLVCVIYKDLIWVYTVCQTIGTIFKLVPGSVAQSVTCLATDASLTADPGVASSIPARSHTFVEIDHEIISTVILLPSAESFKKVVVSYKRSMCTKYWLTACSSLPRKKCG